MSTISYDKIQKIKQIFTNINPSNGQTFLLNKQYHSENLQNSVLYNYLVRENNEILYKIKKESLSKPQMKFNFFLRKLDPISE